MKQTPKRRAAKASRGRGGDLWLYLLLFASMAIFASGVFSYVTKRPNPLVQLASPQTNVLVMGCDRSGETGYGRSDTMLLVGFDPSRRRVNVLSIPRDTRVLIPGHGHDKINAALALGGPSLAMQTVSDLLGVPIHHWAKVNVEGLINLVDLMGGVHFFVDKDMAYTDNAQKLDINLKQGWQDLTGAQAHSYIRFRHDALGDIGRVKRQQEFIKAVKDKLLQPTTLFAYPALLTGAQKNIETDLNAGQIMQLATVFKFSDPRRQKMVMLPGEFSAGRYPVSYWLVDDEEVHTLARRLFGDIDEVEAADNLETRQKYRITILNGTKQPGLASTAAQVMREDGWTIWGLGDSERQDYEKTQVIAQDGDEDLTKLFGKVLKVNAEASDGSIGDLQTDYTIIIGQDFAQALRVH